MTSIRQFVVKLLSSEKQIDILINNTGCYSPTGGMTDEGFDENYAANYLGPFLLTNLLLDLLKSSSSGPIVNSAGFVHGWGEFGTIQFNTQSSPYTAYCNSQLTMVMFTRELAIRLQGTGVRVNCANHGCSNTDLLQDIPSYMKILFLPICFHFLRLQK